MKRMSKGAGLILSISVEILWLSVGAALAVAISTLVLCSKVYAAEGALNSRVLSNISDIQAITQAVYSGVDLSVQQEVCDSELSKSLEHTNALYDEALDTKRNKITDDLISQSLAALGDLAEHCAKHQ